MSISALPSFEQILEQASSDFALSEIDFPKR